MVEEIDVHHLGVPHVICCFADRDGGWLIDPGPEVSHGTLLEALDGWVPDRILLTHIHFDHAGAAGRLAQRWPDVEIWAHSRGARHLADPERLVASARRVYGDAFDGLWGEVVPIPAERLVVLEGGEERDGFTVAYTPGHASHHVSYLHAGTGTAFCGDVAGVRVIDGPVMPPTPPPDIDLGAWRTSLEQIAGWHPTSLGVTHFGRYGDVAVHLESLLDGLERWSADGKALDQETFAAKMVAYIDEHTGGAIAPRAYEQAMPATTQWEGLTRYWSKQAP